MRRNQKADISRSASEFSRIHLSNAQQVASPSWPQDGSLSLSGLPLPTLEKDKEGEREDVVSKTCTEIAGRLSLMLHGLCHVTIPR